MKLAFLFFISGALAYWPAGKDNYLAGLFLRDLTNRMGKDLSDLSYLDLSDGSLPLGVRSLGGRDEEQLFPMDYDSFGENGIHPSIRDQEYLEHSSLWGNQYVSGGAGEGKQRLRPEGNMNNRQEVKTDATLPAYCNPPNPCPVGYSGQQGCIEDFENTASFSRRYQASQDCMCDTEHMFDCSNPSDPMIEDPMDSFSDMDFNSFLEYTRKMNPALVHKNLVAKKFHKSAKKSSKINPFLTGERLPVAAKKGKNVLF